ncbi:hypothetical protein D3C87_1732480 [compost metagenome]
MSVCQHVWRAACLLDFEDDTANLGADMIQMLNKSLVIKRIAIRMLLIICRENFRRSQFSREEIV